MPIARRILASLVVGVLLLIAPAPTAHAEPTSGVTAAQVSDAAKTSCASLPSGWDQLKFTDLKATCEEMVTKAIDPSQSLAADVICGLETLGILAALKQTCIDLLTPVINSAETTLLGAVDCVASTATGDVFSCARKLVHRMIADGVGYLWSGLVAVMTAPSQATSMVDLAGPNPPATAAAFRSVYADVGQIALGVIAIFFVASIMQSVVQRNMRGFKNALMGTMEWGLFWIGGIVLAQMLLSLGDGLAGLLAGENGSKLAADAAKISTWLDAVAGPFANNPMMPWDAGSVVGIVMVLLLLLAMLINWITLAVRDVSLVLMAVALPILLAMRAGPDSIRKALPKAIAAFITIAMAKPLLVIGLRIAGAFMASSTEDTSAQLNLQAVFVGLTAFVLTAFFPGVVYKLLSVTGAAVGQRVGGGPSAPEQVGRGLVDSMDMARQSGRMNGVGPVAAVGGSGGGQAAAGGGRAAGGAVSGAARGAGSVLGGLTAAVAVGSTIAGAGVSVASHVASMAGTGGGAVGDTEQPHVPAVPRSYGPGSSAPGVPSTSSAPASPAPIQAAPAPAPVSAPAAPTQQPAPPAPIAPSPGGAAGSVPPPASIPPRPSTSNRP